MIIAILVLLGLCFGSFINALVWRLHQQSNAKKAKKELSITNGRSMCVHCRHVLAWYDLLPVVSWIMLRGKCHYCSKLISWQYPIVELCTAALFITSYVYWPNQLESLEIAIFSLWLASLVGLVALLVYDIRWMLLPNRLIFPLYGLAAVYVLLRAVQASPLSVITSVALSVLVGGGIFYILFQVSSGRWIGGGDVKLGFLLGALVGSPTNAFMVLFFASLLGCLIAVPLLVGRKASTSTRIPFGPFLIVASIIVVLFGSGITNWYTDTLILGI